MGFHLVWYMLACARQSTLLRVVVQWDYVSVTISEMSLPGSTTAIVSRCKAKHVGLDGLVEAMCDVQVKSLWAQSGRPQTMQASVVEGLGYNQT